MPTLKITSIYNAHRRQFADELALARVDLAAFKTKLVVRFGKDMADVIEMHTHPTEDLMFGMVEVPKLTTEGEAAAKTMAVLIEKLTAVRKRIRTPDCWFREPVTPISVLATVGQSWGQVRASCSEDGRLPVEQVLWLLGVLRRTTQVMPSDERMYRWIAEMHDDARAPWCWRRVLRDRRRRLIRLLGTAAELEEEVRFCRSRRIGDPLS